LADVAMIRFSVDGGQLQTYCDVCTDWPYLNALEAEGRLSEVETDGMFATWIDEPCALCGQTVEGERLERYRRRHQNVLKDGGAK